MVLAASGGGQTSHAASVKSVCGLAFQAGLAHGSDRLGEADVERIVAAYRAGLRTHLASSSGLQRTTVATNTSPVGAASVPAPAPLEGEGVFSPRKHYRNPCSFCGSVVPDHAGRDCAQNPRNQGEEVPQAQPRLISRAASVGWFRGDKKEDLLRSLKVSSEVWEAAVQKAPAVDPGARCDEFGRFASEQAAYLLIRTRPEGPVVGWYIGSWTQFKGLVPNRILPQSGYHYRRGGDEASNREALLKWFDQGHPTAPRVFKIH